MSLASKSVTATQARREMWKSLSKPTSSLEFKIRVEENRKLYFLVRLYCNQSDFRTFRQKIAPERAARYEAWALTDIDCASGNRLGLIAMPLDAVTDRIVVHECLHAAIGYVTKYRLEFDQSRFVQWEHEAHEILADTLDGLVSQFWKNFTKAGFEREQCWGWVSKVG